MPKISPISAKKMMRILKNLDFELVRIKGSHHFFLNKKTRRTTVIPLHSREELSTGILREILKDIELSPDQFSQIRK
ncbi:type II toxin-antitoxin system HicA family toxin [Candidatus Gribaldobacteria bacterium]|nr:type II toxin-antitoxin system HicA family toxin [Candidatus Gribaldobacteria bacterium]